MTSRNNVNSQKSYVNSMTSERNNIAYEIHAALAKDIYESKYQYDRSDLSVDVARTKAEIEAENELQIFTKTIIEQTGAKVRLSEAELWLSNEVTSDHAAFHDWAKNRIAQLEREL